MERFLSAFVSEAQAGGQSLLVNIRIAVLPIAKVFTMCFLGFILASKYVNILPASGRRLLNRLGQSITMEKIFQWWFIPANIVLTAISGSLIGLIVASIVRPPYPFFKFTIVQIGIGNIGNVPLVIIAALCRDESNPFGDSEKCSTYGIAYISFGQWGTFDIKDESIPVKNLQKDHTPVLVPLLLQEIPSTYSDPSKKEETKGFLMYWFEKLKLKLFFQPPIVASVLAMVMGVIPFLRRLIFTPDAPLFFFTDSCKILGGAMIPCILLALGGNLVEGPGNSKLGLRTTVAIIFARLFLVPPTGLGIVMLADKLGFLPPDDKMFRFVLLLQHSMPTSILSSTVATLRGCGRESAAILFWVHIFAIISMAGWLVLYLRILF
ncbi:Protein PIN-LIKES 6, partial [Cucurbita argyrosperma subsp. argyrosperma]